MLHLSTLFRLSPKSSLYLSIRGPKKKGQVQAKIQSNDIINIFKQRKDPQPKQIQQYPIYVREMSLGTHSIHELSYATALNIKCMMPTLPLYRSYMRGLKRQRFKAIRQYKQLDLKPLDKSENFDIHQRTTLYDVFGKSKEEQEAEQKAAQAAEEEEEDDDQD